MIPVALYWLDPATTAWIAVVTAWVGSLCSWWQATSDIGSEADGIPAPRPSAPDRVAGVNRPRIGSGVDVASTAPRPPHT